MKSPLLLPIYCLAGLLMLMAPAFGQQRQLTGIVHSANGRPVPMASVLLKNNDGQIILYKNTNNEGKYALELPDTARVINLMIEVNHLGYARLQQRLNLQQTNYDFLLEERPIEVKEVVIKNQPRITSNGDTTTFDVNSFARPEDRYVGDVMGRMPGLELKENGQITYNGRDITNMLIDGDDLMNGRYGMAPRTITKDMIKSIQVIRNHQPIKVLKNKVITDNVYVNLVLKDEHSFRLSGQGMLGGGLPAQFDAAFNTMILNKKFKMLNALKSNNAGVDFRDDFAQLGVAGLGGGPQGIKPSPLLSEVIAGNPDLPKGNYYFNRSGVVNANSLVNLKKDVQLKANIQLFSDRNTLAFSSLAENYLGNDTIRYQENQLALRNPFVANTSFTTMINREKLFFNNHLRFNYSDDDRESTLNFNGQGFGQHLTSKVYDISNELNLTPAIGKKSFIELRWLISYYKNPQALAIGAGLNPGILNNGQPFAAINQYATLPTLTNHFTAAYGYAKGSIQQSYQFGLLSERQQFNTLLALTGTDGSIHAYPGDQGNALQWKNDKIYLNAVFGIKKETWDAGLTLPVAWQNIRYSDPSFNLDNAKDRLLVNPSMRLKVYLNPQDYLSANYSFSNSIGNSASVYRGAVLTNYRSLQANDAGLQERGSTGGGINYSFQRALQMLFINTSVSYSKTRLNALLSTVLTNNVQRTVLLPIENEQRNFAATAGISKFIFALKTTASLKGNFNTGHASQLINAELLPFVNQSFGIGGALDGKLGKISIGYNGNQQWNISRQQNSDQKSTFQRLDQSISLGYSPKAKFFVNAQLRQVYSVRPGMADVHYLFGDVKMRFKALKWRTDLDLDITNIANVKSYDLLLLNASQYLRNHYTLRGRMAILRATFNL